MLVSIVIRTYNEERYLPELLAAIQRQRLPSMACEVVIVDSGSTDRTAEIAKAHGCRVVTIPKASFSFGRSLNLGCRASRGDFLVFISGHCVPASEDWLANLLAPLVEQLAGYTYGRQLGSDASKFSECRLFEKYFPPVSKVPQEGIFCNNANAAIARAQWERYLFDEELTGLEDMALAKRMVRDGGAIAYVAEAPVFHHHHETWAQVKRRYYREALALRSIMPEVHLTFLDFVRYVASAVALDVGMLFKERRSPAVMAEILLFRLMQFWGSYRGNRETRKLSNQKKELYFYPR